ncbi:MAG: type II toxin-antitoxin system YafQ family toxin [Sulfuricurvum sp.]|nr:type II toxin-antitoxin system YafQ family toxin [Sulfuricurvum sp.]
MQLFRTKIFQKEYLKIKMSDLHYAKYLKYITTLLDSKPLPAEAKDHPLLGEYTNFREFHISGDLLIIYCIEDDILKLTRIGSHSQLFN